MRHSLSAVLCLALIGCGSSSSGGDASTSAGGAGGAAGAGGGGGAAGSTMVGAVEAFAEVAASTEGIAFGTDGLLYAGSAGAVWKIDAMATVTKVADVPAPLGIAPRADGSLIVCGKAAGDAGKVDLPGVIWAVVPSSGQATMLVPPSVYGLPNMIAVAPDDAFVFSDSKLGKVFSSSADGASVKSIADISYANGIAFSPDGKTLYVSSYDMKRIHQIPRMADGTYGAAAVAYENVENVDGITVLASGDFVLVRTGEITRMTKDGTLMALAPGGSIGIPANGAMGAGAFGEGWLYVSNLPLPVR
jgi:sugar lactone lactonase YvrE